MTFFSTSEGLQQRAMTPCSPSAHNSRRAHDDGSDLLRRIGIDNNAMIAQQLETGFHANLGGGVEVAVLCIEINISGRFETFITGEGSDTIEIKAFNAGAKGSADAGLFADVTDFTPCEDIIIRDTSFLLANTASGCAEGFARPLP